MKHNPHPYHPPISEERREDGEVGSDDFTLFFLGQPCRRSPHRVTQECIVTTHQWLCVSAGENKTSTGTVRKKKFKDIAYALAGHGVVWSRMSLARPTGRSGGARLLSVLSIETPSVEG